MSRTKLIAKIYSGLLQASTLSLCPSLEIFFLPKYAFPLILGIAKLPERFQLCIWWCPRDSPCVLLQEKAKDEKQGYRKRSPFSFHTKNWSGKHTVCSVVREIL